MDHISNLVYLNETDYNDAGTKKLNAKGVIWESCHQGKLKEINNTIPSFTT